MLIRSSIPFGAGQHALSSRACEQLSWFVRRRRPRRGAMGEHGIEDDEELAAAGDEGDLGRLAGGAEAGIEGLERRVVADGLSTADRPSRGSVPSRARPCRCGLDGPRQLSELSMRTRRGDHARRRSRRSEGSPVCCAPSRRPPPRSSGGACHQDTRDLILTGSGHGRRDAVHRSYPDAPGA